MLSRRNMLETALALAAPTGRDQRIVTENLRRGTANWQLSKVWPDAGKGFRSKRIEGYCSHQSIAAGETLTLFVSTQPARRWTVDFYRMGYYGGTGGRWMTQIGPFAGRVQPDPPVAEHRLRECSWEPSASLRIPTDWPSGVYLGKLQCLAESSGEHPWQSYVIFVVRDTRRAGVLFQVSDNTWQAYNRWPDDYSLYTDPRHSWAPDVMASFDRPYGKYAQIFDHPLSIGSGEFLLWEFPLSYWLEKHGYDVTYVSNADMVRAEEWTRAKVFLSVAHDEYWDRRQYDNALASVASGTTHLYLSGNAVCGVTPLTANAAGRANRRIQRVGVYGGIYGGMDQFFRYPFREEGPPANRLMGAHTVYPFNGGGDWICRRAAHWMFAGTGMRDGDRVEGLVGWEFHGDPARIDGLEVVAGGTALQNGVNPSQWTATIYPGPKGNFVFNAATIWWAQALASPPGHILPWSHWVRPLGVDERVQRITANLLKRALQPL